VKVALDANRRRVEKVLALVEAFTGDKGVELESAASVEGERVVVTILSPPGDTCSR